MPVSGPVLFRITVQSIKGKSRRGWDNTDPDENFKRNEVKTETNRNKKGKRLFDSLSNAARGTGHVPKGRCPPIPDFVWSPPLHHLLVSRLRSALCLVLARLVQCTYETHISIKDLSCKRTLSRTRCFAFNPMLLSFFSLAFYPLFVPLFNALNFVIRIRFMHRNNIES